MNIVHISPVFSPYFSGMTNVVVNQTRELTKRGHHISVLTPRYDSNWEKEEVIEGVSVKRITPLLKYGNGGFVPGLDPALHKLAQSQKIDAVHLHTPFFGGVETVWLARHVGILKKIKTVVQYHHDPQLSLLTWGLSIPSKVIFTSLIKSVDSVIVSSLDYAKESDVSLFIDKRFVEIPFGIDTDRFSPKKQNSSTHSKIPKLLFVGALDKAHHFKGVEVLLSALSVVDKPFHLDVVGGGDMLEQYRQQSKDLELTDKITFHGRVSDAALPKFHAHADIFVFPSTGKAEAFGLVALEAMSAGLPVIASSLPGVRSLFETNELLVSPENSDELAKKITHLLNNEQLRRTIGERNRQRVLRTYTWEKVTDQLESVYA